MTQPLHVENAVALTDIFGYWPSFHDAEVLTLHLERADKDGPSLEARIHVFHRSDRIDERGFYIREHHTIATLHFANIDLNDLGGFNGSNVLSEIEIEEVDPAANEGRRLGVSFASSFGESLDLRCDRISVKAVEPFVEAI